MKHFLFKRSLVIGVILLLAGISFMFSRDDGKEISTISSTWERVYSHTGLQDGRDVSVSLNGTEYFVTGRSGVSQWQAFLLKTDSQGQELFFHSQYGPWSIYDAGFCLTPTIDGGFVMGGKTQHILGGDFDNILVFKTDSNGNVLWNHEYDILNSDYFDRMWDIIELSDGNLIGCGPISQEPTYHDAGLIKMNSQGEKMWHQSYGQPGTTETVRTLIETSDGGFLIAGYHGWDGNEVNMKCQLYVIKTDANGNEEWNGIYGDENEWNVANWVGETPCGNYMIAGRTGEEENGTNGWVLKLDPFGNMLWNKVIGGSYNDWFTDGFIDDNGNYILVGLTQSYSSNPGTSENNRDGWIISIHPEGYTLWEKVYGVSGIREEFTAIDGPTADNSYIAAGTSNWNVYMVKFAPPQNQVTNIDTGEVYESIQDAIDDPLTLQGHTLSVLNGIYRENVIINKPITLIGESKNNTIIDGRSIGNTVTITVGGVNIRKFTIQNCEVVYGSSPLYAGIKIESNNNVVENNNIRDCHNGIYVSGTTGNIVSNNRITNDRWCFTGILLYESSGNKLFSNNITNSLAQGIGIFLEKSSNNDIFANTIYDNYFGIYLFDASNENIIHHNNFIDNIYYNAYISNYAGSCTGNKWYFEYTSCGNYWSDHTGPDVNNDGIIEDTPYDIPGGLIEENDEDMHPLVDQWTPVCGNVNGGPDGRVTISDVSYLNNYLFVNFDPAPIPPCSADLNGNGQITIGDVSILIDHLFISGRPLPQNCCCKD